MSEGIRSGVNWMRLKFMSSTSAIVLTIRVLARPGMPIMRTWPSEMIAVSNCMTISFWPMIALAISVSMVFVRWLIWRIIS